MLLSYQLTSQYFVRLVILTIFASYIISFPLWGYNRMFPHFPIFNITFQNNFLFTVLQYGFLVISVICFFIPKRKVIISVFIYLGILICLDQLRLQPWIYFLSLCLIPFTFLNKEYDFSQYLKWLFIILYFWSGIHKLNPNFTSVIFESIIVDGFKISDVFVLSKLKKVSFILPLIELSIVFFLLLKKTRKLGLLLLIFTHLFIIYFLVLGVQGNYVIIPWNIFMIIVGYSLFNDKRYYLKLPQHIFMKITLLIITILPIGFLIGKIDQSVSFSLYDGKLKSLYLLSKQTKYGQNYIDNKLFKKGSIKDFNAWSFNELKVPFYPENRFIKRLQESNIVINNKLLVTKTPIYKRNLLGCFKNKVELENYTKVEAIENVIFIKKLYFPEFKIIK